MICGERESAKLGSRDGVEEEKDNAGKARLGEKGKPDQKKFT